MTYSSSGGTTNHDENVAIIRNYNPTGVTLVSPSVDSSGTATPVGSGTTINSPSIAAAGASELLLVIYAAGTNPTGYSGTWTIPGGLGYDFSYNSSSIISDGEGSLQAPSNPTGNFTGTASSATNLGSGAVSFKIGGTALVPRKSVVF